MIHRIIGIQGCGKTGFMSMKGFEDFANGRTIFANYHLAYPHIFINRDFVLSLAEEDTSIKEKCTFLLDEYWLFCSDARRTQSKANLLSSYFLLQTSKTDINVYTTAQTDAQDDSRLRDNAHFMTECKKVIRMPDGRYLDLISEKRKQPEFINERLFIEAHTQKLSTYGYMDYKTERIFAKMFFRLYNTSERIFHKEIKK